APAADLGELPPADAVCNLAAALPGGEESADTARRCFEVNALGALALAEAALARPGCRFVQLSTGNFYAAGDSPAAEDCAIFPARVAVSYFASKLAAELYIG